MKAIEFFENNSSRAGEFISQPFEARKVKAGDSVIINMGFNIEATAAEDGWQLIANGRYGFVNDADFARSYQAVNKVGTLPVPEGAIITPVKKGDTIIVYPGFETTAGADGVLLAQSGHLGTFWSAAEFSATFNSTAAAPSDQQGMYCTKPIPYIVLDKKTVFEGVNGDWYAERGDILFRNEKDENGVNGCSAYEFEKSGHIITKAAQPLTAEPVPQRKK